MPAMPKPIGPHRTQSMYEQAMEQLATIEERAPANLVRIQRTIGLYERIYGMQSSEMREKLAAGEIDETNDICAWSEQIDLLQRVLARGE